MFSLKLILCTTTALLSFATAAPKADKVEVVPGFAPTKFSVYSGYLNVPGPFTQNDYDSLSIHYQFHESQGNPATGQWQCPTLVFVRFRISCGPFLKLTGVKRNLARA